MLETETCHRCKSKAAVVSCLMCDSFKFLCANCDNYVHSLPSKKKHKKTNLLEEINKYIQEDQEKDISYKNNISNLSFQNDRDSRMNSKLKDYKNADSYNIENDYVEMKSFERSEKINDKEKTNIRNLSSTSHSGYHRLNFPETTANLNNFSREYMNELKNIYEKEKNELVYKNSSLQNNLDKLKSNFSEQINLLNREIEEMQKKHNFNLKNIEETFQSELDSLIIQKDEQIFKLNCRVKELEVINSEINFKLEENNKLMEEYKNTTSTKYYELQLELRNRDLDIQSLKNNIDKIQEFHARKMEQENNKIIYDYEIKIESIIKQFEESRNQINKVVEEKERQIEILINKHLEELNLLERTKDEMRAEIDCHKTNILAMRNKRNTIEHEIMQLNEFVEKLKQDLRSQNAEIKILENQNHKLSNENDEFKYKITKLEKLVYGKVKSPKLLR